ncbi:MAG: cation-translocating P-type ATPase [Verrucomicrobiae bacterium]|nr:cation-translocating P-type ATPase [Verrucomicrobiae bacterium]
MQTRLGQTELHVSGMTCANCARAVVDAIKAVPGVRDAAVELDSGRATVFWAPGAAQDVTAVADAIARAGFSAKVPVPHVPEDQSAPHAPWQANLWIGAIATTLLAIGEWALGWGSVPWFRWASFALATVVQVFAGAKFYRGAWTQLRAGRSNMDTLVALGSTTAFSYSAWVLLTGRDSHLYFCEAAAIITIISLGHWLEARVSAKAAVALKTLMQLAPDKAMRRNPDGTETEVPVAQLQPGDLVVLRAGDRVPTDGVVVEGQSAVDESMLTGESVPVEKNVGSQLFAGTINLTGRIVQRVLATGEQTALANIIAAVRRAQTSRANIQRLADRISSVFVPVVVLIAICTALVWGLMPEHARALHERLSAFLWHVDPPESAAAAAFICAAAVLIIACPCAMGLATPAAIMAAANAAARRGILIRDGVALEKAGQITAVMFDKTGTLTVGRPTVAQTWLANQAHQRATQRSNQTVPVNGLNATSAGIDAVALAAGLARHSTHPLSVAIAQLAKAEIAFDRVNEVRGAGLEGILSAAMSDRPGHAPSSGDAMVRLGSIRWLEQNGILLGDAAAFVQHWSNNGATVLGLAVDGTILAAFALQDTLKPRAAEIVRKLTQRGLKVYLVTGDTRATALRIAEQAGIPAENVFAEIKPEQKAELVKQLQARGERVAFVGDGINDAPAIEQADLGLAVGRATDIARQAADVILLKSELDAVPEAIGLARATLRIIKQNLFWAFFYNVASVPLAALGFLSPILCAAAMGLSDLIVLGNALRLLRSQFAP